MRCCSTLAFSQLLLSSLHRGEAVLCPRIVRVRVRARACVHRVRVCVRLRACVGACVRASGGVYNFPRCRVSVGASSFS